MNYHAKNTSRDRAEKQAALFDGIQAGATITALTPTPRDPTRYAIRVERRIVAKIDAAALRDLNLNIGDAWSPALAHRIKDRCDFERHRAFAMRSLSHRPLSKRDLISKLITRGADPAVANQVAAEMARRRFIDDEAFSEALLRSATRSKPAGARLLRAKLRSKGIPTDIADEALRRATESADPFAEALSLAEKRARTMSPRLDAATRTRRLLGLLGRRGFDADVARRAATEALKASIDEPEYQS